MKRISYIFSVLVSVTLAACTKTPITMLGDPATGAKVKFLHVAPGTPALDEFLNGVKVTPVAANSVTDNGTVISITTGIIYNYLGSPTTYLGQFPGSNYSNVTSGSTVIKVQTSTPSITLTSPQTSAPGNIIGSVTQNTTDGSYYSAFALGLPGSATTPLTVKVVEDKFTQTDATKAYVRFANMVPNGAAYDLQGTYTLTGATAATTAVITSSTAYPTVTDFVAVPVNPISTTNYTFQMYAAGTTTKFGAVSAAIALGPGKYYTIIGRGLAADYAVPGTSITLRASARPTPPSTSPLVTQPEVYFAPPQLVFYTNK